MRTTIPQEDRVRLIQEAVARFRSDPDAWPAALTDQLGVDFEGAVWELDMIEQQQEPIWQGLPSS